MSRTTGVARSGISSVALRIVRHPVLFCVTPSSQRREQVDPAVPVQLLESVHVLLAAYLSPNSSPLDAFASSSSASTTTAVVSESLLRDNFDIVLALVDEIGAFNSGDSSRDSRAPLKLTEQSSLKELVLPPAALLSRLLALASSAAAAATTSSASAASNAQQLIDSPLDGTAAAWLASPIPWRRRNVRHSSNEVYFDLVEHSEAVLDASQAQQLPSIVSASTNGTIACRAALSGMPELALTLHDARHSIDNDGEAIQLHPCVRTKRFRRDRTLSFVPPEGHFVLARYRAASAAAASASAGSTTTTTTTLGAGQKRKTSASMLHSALPIVPVVHATRGVAGGTFHVSLSTLAPVSAPLERLVITISLPGAVLPGGVHASVSGGAVARHRHEANGAGAFEVTGNGAVVWSIERLSSLDKPAVISGQYTSSSSSSSSSSSGSVQVTVQYASPLASLSSVKIAGLKLHGESYALYKGIRARGTGTIHVRT